jgi:ssDNA thymidine ADP-ribosyltransferase, DarT
VKSEQPLYLFHIAHIRYLPLILRSQGFMAVNMRPPAPQGFPRIFHRHLQDRRASTSVPCGPGGTLHDYVPFQFAPRSPMLYAMRRGGVERYEEGQEPILHFVSTVQEVQRARLDFVFTNGHAVVKLTDFFTDPSQLVRIDWQVMKARYWADTVKDPDRARRRQAEFLVHRFFPWDLVTNIGVSSSRMKKQVEQILQKTAHQPGVAIQRNWYY